MDEDNASPLSPQRRLVRRHYSQHGPRRTALRSEDHQSHVHPDNNVQANSSSQAHEAASPATTTRSMTHLATGGSASTVPGAIQTQPGPSAPAVLLHSLQHGPGVARTERLQALSREEEMQQLQDAMVPSRILEAELADRNQNQPGNAVASNMYGFSVLTASLPSFYGPIHQFFDAGLPLPQTRPQEQRKLELYKTHSIGQYRSVTFAALSEEEAKLAWYLYLHDGEPSAISRLLCRQREDATPKAEPKCTRVLQQMFGDFEDSCPSSPDDKALWRQEVQEYAVDIAASVDDVARQQNLIQALDHTDAIREHDGDWSVVLERARLRRDLKAGKTARRKGQGDKILAEAAKEVTRAHKRQLLWGYEDGDTRGLACFLYRRLLEQAGCIAKEEEGEEG